MTRYRWPIVAVLVVVVVVVLNTYLGFVAVAHTVYRSSEQVFEDFSNGPIRFLLPLVAAVVAGWPLAARLSHRQISSTRTRISVRSLITRWVGVTIGWAFVAGFATGAVSWICAFLIVPRAEPKVINPHFYGLSGAESVIDDAVRRAPISALLYDGPVAFGTGSSAWLGLNAAVFALVALWAVLIVRRPILALLVPLAIYIVESVLLQQLDYPGASFLLSAVFPTGLQSYPFVEALVPTLLLAGIAVVGTGIVIARAPRNDRFS